MRTYIVDLHTDFTCKHCGYWVNTHKSISGVVNRNHCPYCLYSRHVDLLNAGDRLCACKGMMPPVGLTFKKSRDKFAHKHQGELMLVHCCDHCGHLSINRIAADDEPIQLLSVFEQSSPERHHLNLVCREQGISLLNSTDRPLLHTRLFGAVSDKVPYYNLVG